MSTIRKGKRYNQAVAERPKGPLPLSGAAGFVKEHAKAGFDETIELHVRLGVDIKKSDQTVRGTVSFPHGAPHEVRVVVFSDDSAQQDAARNAGADRAGGSELIEEVKQQDKLDADVVVASPSIMKELAKIAKILGPRGLMPSPKSGTIGDNPAEIVKQLKGGTVSFKMDQGGIIHTAVGKASWEKEHIEENASALIQAIKQARPKTLKGDLIRAVFMSSTMGPSIETNA